MVLIKFEIDGPCSTGPDFLPADRNISSWLLSEAVADTKACANACRKPSNHIRVQSTSSGKNRYYNHSYSWLF